MLLLCPMRLSSSQTALEYFGSRLHDCEPAFRHLYLVFSLCINFRTLLHGPTIQLWIIAM